jgi:hypothetical protein
LTREFGTKNIKEEGKRKKGNGCATVALSPFSICTFCVRFSVAASGGPVEVVLKNIGF